MLLGQVIGEHFTRMCMYVFELRISPTPFPTALISDSATRAPTRALPPPRPHCARHAAGLSRWGRHARGPPGVVVPCGLLAAWRRGGGDYNPQGRRRRGLRGSGRPGEAARQRGRRRGAEPSRAAPCPLRAPAPCGVRAAGAMGNGMNKVTPPGGTAPTPPPLHRTCPPNKGGERKEGRGLSPARFGG